MGLNISKADLEKLVGSKRMGWYDKNGNFCILDSSKLIRFVVANPTLVLEDYKRQLHEKYIDDAKASDDLYPHEKKTEALENYFEFCEELSKLISSKSASLQTDSSVLTPVA